MKIVVVRSPKLLAGIFRMVFHIKKSDAAAEEPKTAAFPWWKGGGCHILHMQQNVSITIRCIKNCLRKSEGSSLLDSFYQKRLCVLYCCTAVHLYWFNSQSR